MSNDLNRWDGIGRLGKDPDMRYSPDGSAVANFSIACGWKGKEKEGTEWVRIVAFGKLAEIIGQYCQKGKQIYVSGRLTTRKWQDKEGNDRYTTEIVANDMQMLGSRGDGQQGSQQSAPPQTSGGGGSTENPEDYGEDIPFITRSGMY